ncbi:Zinc finger protein MSS1 [Saitozyma sp. JCM 24511]|nr:Zinc finger protein MSS1 [Saitozyma sp. JCM 24511]
MSTDTSPTHGGHLPPAYTQTAQLAGHPLPPPSAQAPFGDIKPDDVVEETRTPTKGKNGATGPAEGKAKPHVCQTCQRGFTTGGHLQRHQRIHTGVKAFKCPFPGCETRTSRQDNLQQHYRTHLSPTLRRGSGSAARAAVNSAMEAAGLKSSSSRAPRKSKGSAAGTPSSTTSAGTGHLPSPYATPTSQAPYAPYMYDPAHGGYPSYPIPPPNLAMPQSASTNSSRVPSPVNGHASVPPQQYFPQPFSPAYGYPGAMHQQAYRYAPTQPYGAPHGHHALYSPGIAAEHGQQHMYSPMQTGFNGHSREGSYGVLTPGYQAMSNGYPPRTQTSTPLSQSHDDRAYRPASPGRRRSPPHDLLAQGVVDPTTMSSRQPQAAAYPAYAHMPYNYGAAQPLPAARVEGHRASISSASDGSGNGASDGPKPMHQA